MGFINVSDQHSSCHCGVSISIGRLFSLGNPVVRDEVVYGDHHLYLRLFTFSLFSHFSINSLQLLLSVAVAINSPPTLFLLI